MYRHILIATDGSAVSEQAADAAIALARALGSRLTALHVVAELDEPPLEGWAHGDANFPAKLAKALEKRGMLYLDNVREAALKKGVACECAITRGPSPAGQILAEARARGCDLVVMASHGRKAPGGLAGSETLKVVALGGIPVLAHHPLRAARSAAPKTPRRRTS
jgi:nucleotide-binding universal stress UspA family protein